uniref:ADP ribosyltransferase domain-containing protein n=1 Tax=viral metagenome TaxID=1070528 RepID=A0A6C0H4N4_9ZZZZ
MSKKDLNLITLYDITDKPYFLYRSHLIDNSNYVYECVYTSILHNLSFKKTIKGDEYLLLDQRKNLISYNDVLKILNSNKTSFHFKKGKIIMGISKIAIVDNPIFNEKKNISRYLKSKFKDAFYVPRDYFMNRLAYNLFGTMINEEKLLKYSEGLYNDINRFLNDNNYLYGGKKDEDLKKVINVMDEMFMISSVSEDNMILYRGYNTNRLNMSNEIKDNVNLGIQHQFMSTTLDPYTAYQYVIGTKVFDELILFIAINLVSMSIINHFNGSVILNKSIYSKLKDIFITDTTSLMNNDKYIDLQSTIKNLNPIDKTSFYNSIINNIPSSSQILLNSVTSFFLYKGIKKLCCFVVLHLDDGIPYIKLNNLSKTRDEILLPRGLKLTHINTDTNYQIKLGLLYGNFFELIGMSSIINAHHVRVSMSDDLKKKYKKKDKCLKYQVYDLITDDNI